MDGWRKTIVDAFVPNLALVTLVADPDDLLSDEQLQSEITSKGFDLLWFGDPIEFRYLYEQTRVSAIHEGQELVIAFRGDDSLAEQVPFDVLQRARVLEFSLAGLFPALSASVITNLDRSLLDKLDYESIGKAQQPLGDQATLELLTRSALGMSVSDVHTTADFYRLVFRKHLSHFELSGQPAAYIVEHLSHLGRFSQLPVKELVESKQRLLMFLQESWRQYLEIHSGMIADGVKEQAEFYLISEDPLLPPFHHPDIRGYIDDWFLDGSLTPIDHPNAKGLRKTWARVGVYPADSEDHSGRFTELLDSLTNELPAPDARHAVWSDFAMRWGEACRLKATIASPPEEAIEKQFLELQEDIDLRFSNWLTGYFSTLANQPYSPPVMVHHVPKTMSRKLERDKSAKLALIVVDGLSLDQWMTLRSAISLDGETVSIEQRAIFAWIPTVTSVSRQAIFSGKAPLFFPRSISRTDREPILWRQFWEECGVDKDRIEYLKGLGKDDQSAVSEILSNQRVQVLGLVVDTVDKIMHGMELGSAGMHNQVTQWAKNAYLETLISRLIDKEFDVFITSDHGNVEACGSGRISEGVLAESRGERVRVYPNETLQGAAREISATALVWPQSGLPEEYFPLLAGGRSAFIREGETMVCHGGAALEEVLVPYIEIRRREQ
ncbi:BREX-3 system phosphatase PglZ [Pseudomonadota bacterium]